MNDQNTPIDPVSVREALGRVLTTSAALANQAHGSPHDPGSRACYLSLVQAAELLNSAMRQWVR